MAERARSECQQCGQVDDHPKQNIMRVVPDDGGGFSVIGVDTFHHDCLSARDEQMLRNAAQVKGSGPKSSAIIDACKKGTRGEKLLELIEGGKLPQAEGLVHQQSEQEAERAKTADADMQASLASQAHFTQKESDRG